MAGLVKLEKWDVPPMEFRLTFGTSRTGIQVVPFKSVVQACVAAGRFDKDIPVDIFVFLCPGQPVD